MNCNICLDLYDHSINKPFILRCSHTFCKNCLNKLPEKLCPVCKSSINDLLIPNLALLELIPYSSYDKLKEESLKYLSEINEIKNDLAKKRETKLSDYLLRIEKVKTKISQESTFLISSIEANEKKLFNELKQLGIDLEKSFNDASLEDDANYLIDLKKKIESNDLVLDRLEDMKSDALATKSDLINLVKKIDEFNEDYTFIANKIINIEEPVIGILQTNEKLYLKYIGEANELFAYKEFEQSIDYCNKAIEIRKTIEAYMLKGNSCIELCDFELAADCFQKCIEIDPDNFLHYLNAIFAMINSNKLEESIKLLNKAIELKLETSSYLFKGLILACLKRYNESIYFVNKAIEFDPANVKFYISKGIVYTKMENYNENMNCFLIAEKFQKNENEESSIYFTSICINEIEECKQKCLKILHEMIQLETFNILESTRKKDIGESYSFSCNCRNQEIKQEEKKTKVFFFKKLVYYITFEQIFKIL